MKKVVKFSLSLILISLFGSIGCAPRDSQIPQIRVSIQNSLPIERKENPIILTIDQLRKIAPDFSFDAYMILPDAPPENQRERPQPIACQADDLDYDGQKDQLTFLIDLAPSEAKTVSIRYVPKSAKDQMPVMFGFEKRTRAGIFPKFAIHRVIAALESETIRCFLHENGEISIGAKKWKMLNLSEIAENSCGGFRVTDDRSEPIEISGKFDFVQVISDGPIRSIVRRTIPDLQVGDRKITIVSTVSVFAGDRSFLHELEINGETKNLSIQTEIPNFDPLNDLTKNYLASWTAKSGSQNGFAIFYPKNQIDQISDSQISLRLDQEKVSWRAIAVSDQGDNAVKSKSDFERILQLIATELQSPTIVQLSSDRDQNPKTEK